MKTKNVYLEILSEWNEDHNLYTGLCDAIHSNGIESSTRRIKLNLFKPDGRESKRYGMSSCYWGEKASTLGEVPNLNEFRVMVLGFLAVMNDSDFIDEH